MKNFSSGFIEKLNAVTNAGVWLHALVIALPASTDYWVHHAEPVLFNGNTYQPLPMRWEGVEASMTMQLPGVRVSVANVQGQAAAYVEDHDLLGRDVRLQIMHLDLLGTPTDVDELALQIQQIEVNAQAVTALCSLNLGLNDLLPKGIITQTEFPGNTDDIRRLSIV